MFRLNKKYRDSLLRNKTRSNILPIYDNMMNDLKDILNTIYNSNNIKYSQELKILEIGTGNGNNSTQMLYNFALSTNKKFKIISYEGDVSSYENAKKIWMNNKNIDIINEYFTNKLDIMNLLIPNLPEHIIDYDINKESFIKKYLLIEKKINFFSSLQYIPDIIFIDSSRFMHLPIINLCYELLSSDNETIIIMEEDYFINGIYGELELIQKFFILKNVIKYNKGNWQWPFVSFIIESKK